MGPFETILLDGISRGHLPNRTQTARDWYRASAKDFGARIRNADDDDKHQRVDYGRINPTSFLRTYSTDLTTVMKPGSMYMYWYDPKYKEELPFYDRFPLIFPFRVESDRFFALNLHYLNLPLRAKLMDALYDLTNNKAYDETTRLKISYKILSSASKFRWFKPCVKQYLKGHVESKFLYVHPDSWDQALFMPLERFVKASKSQVWSESKASLNI